MSDRIKLNIKETRLVALAVDGDNASTQAPIFATYLSESEPALFELAREEAIPIFTIKDIIVPPRQGRSIRKIKVLFDGELANEEVVEFEFDMDAQYLMTFFPLHLVGETYIAIFDADTKMHPKSKAISNNDLQVMLCLPEVETAEFRHLANKFNMFLSYRATSGVIGSEDFMSNPELEALREVRTELFLTLSDLANGSKEAVETLKTYITPLDSYETNVLVQEQDPTETEMKYDALVTLTDQLLFKINIRNIVPNKLNASEMAQHHKEYDDFMNIMKQNEELTPELEALSINDEKLLKERKNPEAMSSYLAAPIRQNNLPKTMAHLSEYIDFGGLYDTDWTEIDSVSNFIDDSESPYTFGERVVTALIASSIRTARISEVNNTTSVAFFLNIFSDIIKEDTTQDNHWELEAFSEKLAGGDTKLFKELLTGLPKNVPMGTLITVSYLGYVGFALARSIIREAWQQDIIRIAFTDNKIATKYLDEVYSNITKFTEIANENNLFVEEDISQEKKEILESMIDSQITFQSIQEALSTVGEEFENANDIANAMISAMLQLADLNTGKQTVSTINSPEWLAVKKDYINNFFKINENNK